MTDLTGERAADASSLKSAEMLPASPPMERRYARGPTGQVHYYDSTGSGSPVLLIHQAPTSAIDFCAVFPCLISAGFRVLALDLPGMGLSDTPPFQPTVPDFAGAALQVLDDAGVSVVDAVGHHAGAAVAVAAAVRAPGRFSSLVLYGPPALEAEELAALWSRVVPAERESGLFTPEADGSHLSSLFRTLAGRYGEGVANRMVLSRLLCGRRLWFAHNAALTWDMCPELLEVRHRLLLLTHPEEMLHRGTLRAHALRPDADLVVLDYAGPLALDGAPDVWAAAVERFLKVKDLSARLL